MVKSSRGIVRGNKSLLPVSKRNRILPVQPKEKVISNNTSSLNSGVGSIPSTTPMAKDVVPSDSNAVGNIVDKQNLYREERRLRRGNLNLMIKIKICRSEVVVGIVLYTDERMQIYFDFYQKAYL